MPEILDFSKGENTKPLIVQPDFQIYGHRVSVEYRVQKGAPTFHFSVGCQGSYINAENIAYALQEIQSIPYQPVPTKVIVENGKTPKTSCPKLKDEAGDWLIDSKNKAYPKDKYFVFVMDITQKRRFFSPNTRGWDKDTKPLTYKGGYDLTKKDIDKITEILMIMKDYFHAQEPGE